VSEQALIVKIKQRGYWKVAITPCEYLENRFTFAELKLIVEKCAVSLRGWDYPHLDRENTFNRSGYLESYCEFDYLIEYWRLYRSGKFMHLFGMREDGRKESPVPERFRWYAHNNAAPPEGLRGLSIISTIYSLTEIFEFGIRLAKHGVLKTGGTILLDLFGLQNRMLYFEDSGRDLRRPYISRDGHIKLEASFSSAEQLVENGHATALGWFIEVAQLFQWDTPPKNILAEEQKKFLERRI
jgi:hypothetical protein